MPDSPARLARRQRSPRRLTTLKRLAVLGVGGLIALPLASLGPVQAVDNTLGQVNVLGTASALGVPAGRPLTGVARTPSAKGYWLAGADGGVYAYGDAAFFGTPGAGLRQTIVDIAANPSGQGYWLAGGDGGVFAFGSTPFAGSLGAVRLTAPIVGIAATPSGSGYWLAAADGGIFAFGDAAFVGSAGGSPLRSPIVAISATPSGKGYRLLARDGGVFAFGDASFAGAPPSNSGVPFADIATSADGAGYWVVAADGTVTPFGSAPTIPPAPGGASGAPVTAFDVTPTGDGAWLATGGELLGEFGVTCYALRGNTATGAPVAQDIVAVDPRTIPLGTEIFVAGLGIKRAGDTGGGIKGRRLDVWNPSVAFCRDFGIKRLTAYIVR